jgi:chorismate synthase
MAGNTFGTIFRLTSFGESHGAAIGGVIDGCPAGLKLDFKQIAAEMARRKPGQSAYTTSRNEADEVEFLSGIKEGLTLGTPIGFIIRNNDQRVADYDQLKEAYRPSHADFTYASKYGIRDVRGGGRSSARETAVRVAAGAVARQLLESFNIRIAAFVSRIGEVSMNETTTFFSNSLVDKSPVRCPDEIVSIQMQSYIEKVKQTGDTCGGVVTCVVTGMPAGIGEPVFDKLPAVLAAACMSINAAHGFEYGSGFNGATMNGSEHNDPFIQTENGIRTVTNHSGGIQGGISNGMDIYFNVAFKPVATVMQPINTLNESGEQVSLEPVGRHDPCVVPRAVPIVEAMTALAITDLLLRNTTSRISNLIKTND